MLGSDLNRLNHSDGGFRPYCGYSGKQEQADIMRFDWFSVRVPTTGTLRKIRSAELAE